MALRTVDCQTSLSMEFSRQEHWSRLTFPSPEDLPDPGIKPWSPVLQAHSLPSEPSGKSQEDPYVGMIITCIFPKGVTEV